MAELRTKTEFRVTVGFAALPGKIAELCAALGEAPVVQYGGAWIHQVDDAWRVAVNGHRHPVEIPADERNMAVTLGAFEFAVWYHGWIAGLFSAFEGTFAAGEGANENTFIEAINQKIGRL